MIANAPTDFLLLLVQHVLLEHRSVQLLLDVHGVFFQLGDFVLALLDHPMTALVLLHLALLVLAHVVLLVLQLVALALDRLVGALLNAIDRTPRDDVTPTCSSWFSRVMLSICSLSAWRTRSSCTFSLSVRSSVVRRRSALRCVSDAPRRLQRGGRIKRRVTRSNRN